MPDFYTDLVGKTVTCKNLVGADREATIRLVGVDTEGRVALLVSACDGGMWGVFAVDAKLKKECGKKA